MFLVVGSNILSWITAIKVKLGHPSEDVCLIDFSSTLGGNSRSNLFEHQWVDNGMQTYYDTGINWADEIVRRALNINNTEYSEFFWPNHDIASSLQNGIIEKSVFPSVEMNSNSDYLLNLEKNNVDTKKPSNDSSDDIAPFFIDRYGHNVWESCIKRIAKKYTSIDYRDASLVSLAALPLNRIILKNFNDDLLMSSKYLQDRVAFQSAKNIPVSERFARATIYPKEGGIHNLINALRNYAEKVNVRIIASFDPKKLNIKSGALHVDTDMPKICYWGVSNKILLQNLNLLIPDRGPIPMNGSQVSIYAAGGFRSNDLHYLLSYDDDDIFRLTFYGGLGVVNGNEFATIELLVPPNQVSLSSIELWLKKHKFLSANQSCVFSRVHASPWPVTHRKGYVAYKAHEEREISKSISNVVLMNANPAIASVMQTPTIQARLRSTYFD